MPYDRPSLSAIITRILGDIKTRTEDAATFLRRSVFIVFGSVFGATAHLLYDFIEWVKDQLFITTADAEHLERHGAEYGIFRNYGEKATGSVIITGTVGFTLDSGEELDSSSGNKYKTTESATIGGAGTANITIQANEIGTKYNEAVGVTLTFVSPTPGISAVATVIGDGITGGVDADTDLQYRTKILNRKRQPPHGGTEADYVTWALQYSGSITRAWSISEYMGIGTIGLAFVEDNETPIFPDETTREALRTWMISHTDTSTGKTVGIPVTAENGFFVIGLIPYSMDFTIQLYPNTSAVQSAVTAKLAELILQYGGPGNTIEISKMYESITSAAGEEKCRVIYPTADVSVATNRLHVLGTVTFQDYV